MDWLSAGRSTLDILLVTFLLYKVITATWGTKTFSILKGVAFVWLIWVLSGLMGLDTIKFIFSQVILYGVLGLVVIFQPEIRGALEKLGSSRLSSQLVVSGSEKIVVDLVSSLEYMSKRRIGALICIEFEDSLASYASTGVQLNADISEQLITNVFTPNVPLHDGALIIQNGRITSASCYLPLTEREDISKELGTRHRAAIGLSEVADALTLVVSEETGAISISYRKNLYRGISLDEARNHLSILVSTPKKDTKKKSVSLVGEVKK